MRKIVAMVLGTIIICATIGGEYAFADISPGLTIDGHTYMEAASGTASGGGTWSWDGSGSIMLNDFKSDYDIEMGFTMPQKVTITVAGENVMMGSIKGWDSAISINGDGALSVEFISSYSGISIENVGIMAKGIFGAAVSIQDSDVDIENMDGDVGIGVYGGHDGGISSTYQVAISKSHVSVNVKRVSTGICGDEVVFHNSDVSIALEDGKYLVEAIPSEWGSGRIELYNASIATSGVQVYTVMNLANGSEENVIGGGDPYVGYVEIKADSLNNWESEEPTTSIEIEPGVTKIDSGDGPIMTFINLDVVREAIQITASIPANTINLVEYNGDTTQQSTQDTSLEKTFIYGEWQNIPEFIQRMDSSMYFEPFIHSKSEFMNSIDKLDELLIAFWHMNDINKRLRVEIWSGNLYEKYLIKEQLLDVMKNVGDSAFRYEGSTEQKCISTIKKYLKTRKYVADIGEVSGDEVWKKLFKDSYDGVYGEHLSDIISYGDKGLDYLAMFGADYQAGMDMLLSFEKNFSGNQMIIDSINEIKNLYEKEFFTIFNEIILKNVLESGIDEVVSGLKKINPVVEVVDICLKSIDVAGQLSGEKTRTKALLETAICIELQSATQVAYNNALDSAKHIDLSDSRYDDYAKDVANCFVLNQRVLEDMYKKMAKSAGAGMSRQPLRQRYYEYCRDVVSRLSIDDNSNPTLMSYEEYVDSIILLP